MAEGEGVIQHPCVPDGVQDSFSFYFVLPILDVALNYTNARVGIYYCLYPECCDGDSPADADNILDWGDKTVVGVLKPVIKVCSREEASI